MIEYMIWRMDTGGNARLIARTADEGVALELVENNADDLGYTYALKWLGPDKSTSSPGGKVCTFAFGSLDGAEITTVNLLTLVRRIANDNYLYDDRRI